MRMAVSACAHPPPQVSPGPRGLLMSEGVEWGQHGNPLGNNDDEKRLFLSRTTRSLGRGEGLTPLSRCTKGSASELQMCFVSVGCTNKLPTIPTFDSSLASSGKSLTKKEIGTTCFPAEPKAIFQSCGDRLQVNQASAYRGVDLKRLILATIWNKGAT